MQSLPDYTITFALAEFRPTGRCPSFVTFLLAVHFLFEVLPFSFNFIFRFLFLFFVSVLFLLLFDLLRAVVGRVLLKEFMQNYFCYC